MANDTRNNENELDDENINIDDIEGLERDSTNSPSANANDNNLENSSPLSAQETEALELLPDGKLKKATTEETLEEEVPAESFSQKMKKKISMKIVLGGLLLLILILIGFVLLLPMEEKKDETPAAPAAQASIPLPPIETYEFKLDHINVARVNKKLENLTKYELLGMTEEEYLKEEKFKALKKEQEDALKEKMRLEEEALAQKAHLEEEAAKEALAATPLKEDQNTSVTSEGKTILGTPIVQEDSNSTQNNAETATVSQENNGNTFLKFIQINTQQKAIYKPYLKKIQDIDPRVYACRNILNTIEVFIGPLSEDENAALLIENIKKQDSTSETVLIGLTKEEFAKRCMVFEQE